MTTLKNWAALLGVVALLLTVSACGEKPETTGSETTGGGESTVAVVDGPVGTYQGMVTDEMRAQIEAEMETIPEERKAQAQEELAALYAGIEGTEIELNSDNTFTFGAGPGGTAEGTWTIEEEAITLNIVRLSDAEGNLQDVAEGEVSPQTVIWNEDEGTLTMTSMGQQLVLKKV